MTKPGKPPSDSYRRIYEVVARIPRGRVASYGQVASLARLPRQARLVGYALNVLPPGDCPLVPGGEREGHHQPAL